jgi:ElaB/YqjD/DUF883 family membrane-anchored ribosome-binding protein
MAQHISVQRLELRTVEEAQRAVEESRERMSDTLDAIESRLVAKKQELSDRMDVMRPVKQRVRSHPWQAVAVAVGLGLVLSKLREKRHARDEEQKAGRLRRRLHPG